MGVFVSPRHVNMLSESVDVWGWQLPFISFGKQARPHAELLHYLAEQGVASPQLHSVSTLMTIVRMTIEGLGVGALPVATVLDEWQRGELYRLSLPVPLPAMHYDVMWRNTNHLRFCRGVARLAQQCACSYAQARHADMTTTLFAGCWVTSSASSGISEAIHY
jgi:DNA-binding transcriptional LysR family regulator